MAKVAKLPSFNVLFPTARAEANLPVPSANAGKAGQVVKMVVVTCAVAGVAYYLYLKVMTPSDSIIPDVVKGIAEVADINKGGQETTVKAINSFAEGDVRSGLRSSAVSYLKSAPIGNILEAVNSDQSVGGRAAHGILAYGGLVFPPLAIVSWLLPGGDMGTKDYWEGAGNKMGNAIVDMFTGGNPKTRQEEFSWPNPRTREDIYLKLYEEYKKWIREARDPASTFDNNANFWKDPYNQTICHQNGYNWSKADENFMNAWLSFHAYWIYEDHKQTQNLSGEHSWYNQNILMKTKLADGSEKYASAWAKTRDADGNIQPTRYSVKAPLYRLIQDEYWKWLERRDNPDLKNNFKRFWEASTTKSLVTSWNDAARSAGQVWNLPDKDPWNNDVRRVGGPAKQIDTRGAEFTQEDADFMNEALLMVSARWIKQENKYGHW